MLIVLFSCNKWIHDIFSLGQNINRDTQSPLSVTIKVSRLEFSQFWLHCRTWISECDPLLLGKSFPNTGSNFCFKRDNIKLYERQTNWPAGWSSHDKNDRHNLISFSPLLFKNIANVGSFLIHANVMIWWSSVSPASTVSTVSTVSTSEPNVSSG